MLNYTKINTKVKPACSLVENIFCITRNSIYTTINLGSKTIRSVTIVVPISNTNAEVKVKTKKSTKVDISSSSKNTVSCVISTIKRPVHRYAEAVERFCHHRCDEITSSLRRSSLCSTNSS